MQNDNLIPKSDVLDRLDWTDYAKGIAILFVVYRHVVVGLKRSSIVVSDWLYNVQEVFYNFRMPTFFILSGIFVAHSLRKKKTVDVLKNRWQSVLYPYLLWGVLITVLQILFSDFTNSQRTWKDLLNIIIQPRAVDHLWYLFALFNTTFIFIVLNEFSLFKNKWLHISLAIVMHVIAHVAVVRNFSVIGDAFYFYLFFLIGAQLSSFFWDRQKSEKILDKSKLIWVLPVFIAGQWFWFINRDEYSLMYTLPFLMINLVACYFMYIISYQLAEGKVASGLAYIGKYSLYIYILHVPIAAVFRNLFKFAKIGVPTEVIIVVCWAAGIMLPIILYNSFKRYGIRKLFSLKASSK